MGDRIPIKLGFAFLLALTIFISGFTSEAFAVQTGLPDDDIGVICNWDITGPSSWEAVLTSDGDATKITSSTDEQFCQVNIGEPDDPDSLTGHIIHFNAQANGAKGGEKVQIFLYDEGVEKASSGTISIARGSYNCHKTTGHKNSCIK